MSRIGQITALKSKKACGIGMASKRVFSKVKSHSQSLSNRKPHYVIIDGQRFRVVPGRLTSQQLIALASK